MCFSKFSLISCVYVPSGILDFTNSSIRLLGADSQAHTATCWATRVTTIGESRWHQEKAAAEKTKTKSGMVGDVS